MGDRTGFFYGTLMAREILYRVCYGSSNISSDPVKAKLAASLSIQPAILHDFCRHQVKMADYPGIIPEKGHTVRGTYVTGLTDGDISRLDWFEGDEYDRRKVTVALLRPEMGKTLMETEAVETETYVYIAGDHRLKKEEWDFETFRKEKMHRWADQSEEYAEVDEAVANGHDPTGGRGINHNSSTKHDARVEGKEEEVLRSAV